MVRTGYIGLGNIGAPMAHRLAEAGECKVHDVSRSLAAAFASKATWAETPAEVGCAADLVAICVRDDADVRAVVAGPDGLLQTMTSGLIAIHSTVEPDTVIGLAAEAAQHGVSLIDAAVTGGPEAAARGELIVMIGGSAAEVETARPLLGAYCSNMIHAGATGAGMALKICNNLVTYIELVAALEAYRLADALGLDASMLDQVMRGNGNLTPSMDKFVQFRRSGAEQIGADAFRHTQEALVKLGEKDLDLAERAAAAAGVSPEAAIHVRRIFARSIMEGIEA